MAHWESTRHTSSMEISRVGSFTTRWGESLVWDDRRDRLYFVDCAAKTLMWLEDGSVEPSIFQLPSIPTGVVLTQGHELVVVLEDGLHLCDPDGRSHRLLSPFPNELDGRCNDAVADLSGNIITGKLNLTKAPGSTWQYSLVRGWTMLDPDISNTNGPAVLGSAGQATLVVGDTAAHYYAYDYDAEAATIGTRRVYGDMSGLDGGPDGTCCDSEDGLWCAIVGGSQLVRLTADGMSETVPLPVATPTDVTFGGPGMDRLYVTTIGGDGELDGSLLVIDGVRPGGRLEPRANTPS